VISKPFLIGINLTLKLRKVDKIIKVQFKMAHLIAKMKTRNTIAEELVN
jgi:hypothetical protein